MAYNHQLILCIIDEGYSDVVMDAAKSAGATGGTVMHAKGTANKEAEAYFHITIQPNKEIVMILVPSDIRDKVLHALYTQAGLNTMGHGIAFALPVDNVVGLSKKLPATAQNDTQAMNTTHEAAAETAFADTEDNSANAAQSNMDADTVETDTQGDGTEE